MTLTPLAHRVARVLWTGPKTSKQIAQALGISVQAAVNACSFARGTWAITDGSTAISYPEGVAITFPGKPLMWSLRLPFLAAAPWAVKTPFGFYIAREYTLPRCCHCGGWEDDESCLTCHRTSRVIPYDGCECFYCTNWWKVNGSTFIDQLEMRFARLLGEPVHVEVEDAQGNRSLL